VEVVIKVVDCCVTVMMIGTGVDVAVIVIIGVVCRIVLVVLLVAGGGTMVVGVAVVVWVIIIVLGYTKLISLWIITLGFHEATI
jgi:hypothetical protein